MAYDESLRLGGTSGNPKETLTTVGSPYTGTGVYVGKGRVIAVRQTVTGTVTAPGTLNTKLQEDDALAGGYSDIAGGAFPQRTTSDRGSLTGAAGLGGDVTYSVPGLAGDVIVCKTTKDYVRRYSAVAGGGASFAGVDLEIFPLSGGIGSST